MNGTLTVEQVIEETRTSAIDVDDHNIRFVLSDGRSVLIPLEWYPRLQTGTSAERNHWELIGDGEGVHWPDLDEDISTQGILLGRRSGESAKSFERWLARRNG